MKNILLSQFDLHHRLYNNVLDGFMDEESNTRWNGNKNVNHVKYLAGHLLNSQYGIGLLAGVKLERKWDHHFAAMGQSAARDDVEYPSIEEIKAEWNAIHPVIREGLQNLSGESLNRKPPKPMDVVFEDSPIFDNSVGDFLAFLNHHQAYHIGQIGLLRRAFGKKPMEY